MRAWYILSVPLGIAWVFALAPLTNRGPGWLFWTVVFVGGALIIPTWLRMILKA